MKLVSVEILICMCVSAKKGKKSKVSKEGKSEGDKTPSAEVQKSPGVCELNK